MPQSSRNQRKARKRYYERRRGSKRFSLSEKQKKQFEQFQDRIGLTFENTKLLTQAFTHSSYVNEHRIHSFHDNERLEFLGDAVLELSVSQFLFRKFPAMSEGEMTKLRAAIVCEPSLAKFALELDFGTLVLLGKGEEITGGRSRSALLADAFESFIGALFLDQGIEAVYQFLDHTIFPKVNEGVFFSFDGFQKSVTGIYSARKLRSNPIRDCPRARPGA